MTSQFNITPISKRDFSEWVRVRREAWKNAGKKDLEETFNEIIKSKNLTAFMCRDGNGNLIGYVEVSVRRDYVEGSNSYPVGYLEEIVVSKKYRNQGVAKMLVRKAEEWAQKRGFLEMGSDTELTNRSSQKFHRALGFKKVGTNVSYLKKIKR